MSIDSSYESPSFRASENSSLLMELMRTSCSHRIADWLWMGGRAKFLRGSQKIYPGTVVLLMGVDAIPTDSEFRTGDNFNRLSVAVRFSLFFVEQNPKHKWCKFQPDNDIAEQCPAGHCRARHRAVGFKIEQRKTDVIGEQNG